MGKRARKTSRARGNRLLFTENPSFFFYSPILSDYLTPPSRSQSRSIFSFLLWQDCPEAKNTLFPVHLSSGNTLENNAETVRSVCDRYVHPQEREEKENQQGSSPAYGVEKARDNAHEKNSGPQKERTLHDSITSS